MRLMNALSVSFVALFLTLTAAVFSIGRPPAGFFVRIANKLPAGENCNLRVTVVDVVDAEWLQLFNSGDGTTRLRTKELGSKLESILRTRPIAVVNVKGNGDLPFGRIAQVIEIVSQQADDVAILTPSVEKQPGLCLGTYVPPGPPSPRMTVRRR